MIKNGKISGKGTIEDPFLYAWETFTENTHMAKFLGYTQDWSDVNNSFEINKRVFYKYKVWKRGRTSFFFNEYDWSAFTDLIVLLRQRGFNTSSCHKDLITLNTKSMLRSIKALCKAANSVYDKNTKIILKEGNKVEFFTKEGKQTGTVIKENSKLYVEYKGIDYDDLVQEVKLMTIPVTETSKKFSILRHNIFLKY